MTNFLGFLGKNKIIKIYTKSQSNDRSYHGLKVFFFFFPSSFFSLLQII